MTGFNMPPGCNVRDIPGNRPEDVAHEKLCEEIALILGHEELSDTTFDLLCQWVGLKLNIAYCNGHRDALLEQASAYSARLEQRAKLKEADDHDS